ncbi:hypothetical protein E4U48_005173 [Claviceps purpurea]|nr:hypothetical protein E4U48_005173 [Claviceps purpurea]
MYFPRSLLLLLFITYPAVGAEKSWSKSNLTLELSAYVPPCAEGCFISFLQASIGLRRGQRIPSLQELCSADGKTGFTVGEGAVQCIAAERSIDGCLEQDANSSVIYRAHQMCSGQPGAFTPTHSVITATLVLPPSGGGPVSFPAPSSTHRVSRKPRKSRASKTTKAFTTTGTELPSTLVVDTHSPPRITTATSSSSSSSPPSSSSSSSATASSTADTTLRTSVATETRPAETSTTATSTSTSTPTPGAAQGAGRSLTSFQKAGIAVGVIGFALVAAGSLLFLRLCRNKKKPEKKRLSGTQSGKRDSWGQQLGKEHDGSGGGGGNAGGESAWMADLIYPFRDAPGASSTESTVPLTSAAKPTTATPLAETLTTAAAMAGPSKVMKAPEAGSYSKMTPDSKDITSPGANNRISWHHSVLGLAISPVISPNASPTSKRSSVSRPRSKLLPDKPELSLLLGKKPSTVKTAPADTRYYGNTTPYRGPPEKGMASPKPTRASPQRSVLPKLVIPQQHDSEEKLSTVGGTKSRKQPRESNMTEFEEDGRRSSSMSSEGHIWRPPSTEPLSAVTPYYVADKHGNWVLADQNTMSQGAARQGRTAPRTPPLSAYLQLATSAANPPVQNRQPMTERKQIHSPPHRVVAGPGISSPAPANSPSPTRQTIRLVTEAEPPLKGRGRDSEQMFVPRPLFSSATAGSTAASGQLPGRRGGLIQPRTPPANSGTTSRTISSRDDGDEERPVMKRMNLSPVVESPWSTKAHTQTDGRWLVSKPQTQGRETTPVGTRANLVPPPRMPISYTSERQQTGSRPIHPSTTPRDGQHGDNRATTARAALPTPTPTPTTDPDKKPRLGASTTEPIISHAIPTPVTSPPNTSLPLSRNISWPTTHNAATVRTGSPTMRIVRPSPEPEPSSSIQPGTSPPRQPQRRPYETRVEEEPWEHVPRPQRQQQHHHHHHQQEQQPHQHQHQHQQEQPQHQQLHAHRPRPALGWIPGLPAHPRLHPQYGPRPINTVTNTNTNTLWVPPQARTTRGMETEPDHHQLTPRRAQRDAQRSLGGVSVSVGVGVGVGVQRQDPQGRGLEMQSSSSEELLGHAARRGR